MASAEPQARKLPMTRAPLLLHVWDISGGVRNGGDFRKWQFPVDDRSLERQLETTALAAK